MSEGCLFCDQSWMRAAEIFIETPPHIRLDPGPGHPGPNRTGGGHPAGSGAIVPIAHRTSVFDLTPAEWADTQDLLLQARMALHDLLAPDGYLLGWNQGGALHSHMHVIPRFSEVTQACGIEHPDRGDDGRLLGHGSTSAPTPTGRSARVICPCISSTALVAVIRPCLQASTTACA
jgi:diadenosine tetraphosphate (Ap4A) HIT family hydrolase